MHIQYGGSTQGLPRVSVGIGSVSFISGVSTWPPVGSPSKLFSMCRMKERSLMFLSRFKSSRMSHQTSVRSKPPIKRLVTSGPTLDRPNPDRLVVVKTDWCCQGMGAVVLQADSTAESLIEERRISKFDSDGKPRDRIPVSNFDRTINGLRLKPIRFASRRCTSDAKKSYHSYIGEAATVRWAVQKFHRYLYGREFLLLGDCSGLSKFFDPQPGDELSPNHQLNRWRAELLAYQFRIEHRPAR